MLAPDGVSVVSGDFFWAQLVKILVFSNPPITHYNYDCSWQNGGIFYKLI